MKPDVGSRVRSLPSSASPVFLGDVVAAARAVSFWLAVVLPWVLLAFVLGGVVNQRPELFGGLLVAFLAFARLGHGHAR